jgi:4-hydroxy-tetrahydrodipicolinate reductase
MGRAISSRFLSDGKLQLVGMVDPAYPQETAGTLSDSAHAGPPQVKDLADLPDDLAADVALDFSTVAAVRGNIEPCLKRGWDVLVGVTGFEDDDHKRFESLAAKYRKRVVLVPNFTIGMNLLFRFAQEAARVFKHVEIIELHHDRKVDSPSGTAVHTARLIGRNRESTSPPGGSDASRGHLIDGIPVHAIRLQGLLAHQEVMFGNEGEVLTIRHDTMDRGAFMSGIYLAIEKLPALHAGFTVGIDWVFTE